MEWGEAVGIRGEGGGAREVTQQVSHTTAHEIYSYNIYWEWFLPKTEDLEPKAIADLNTPLKHYQRTTKYNHFWGNRTFAIQVMASQIRIASEKINNLAS